MPEIPPERQASRVREPLRGGAVGRLARIWLAVQGLVYLASGVLVMVQAVWPGDPARSELTAGLVEHPVLRVLLAAAGAVLLGVGAAMTVRGFTRGRQRALPEAPARLQRHVGWLGGIGAVGRGLALGAGGAVLLVEARAGSAEEADRVGRALRVFWAQPYGRPLLFALGLTLVMFAAYEFAAMAYRRSPDRERP